MGRVCAPLLCGEALIGGAWRLFPWRTRPQARNLAEVRANVMPVFGAQVCIPAPLHGLCTKRVLVMERLRGVTVMDAIRGYLAHTAEVEGTTLGEVEAAARAQMRAGTAGADGSVAQSLAKTGAALRWRDAWGNVGRVAWNWSLGMVPGLGGGVPLVRSKGALDVGAALQTVSPRPCAPFCAMRKTSTLCA